MTFDPNNQVGRVLTLRVVIEDHDASRELWDAFGKGKLLAGCNIRAMGDGDAFDERDKYKRIADSAMEDKSCDYPDDEPETVETECGKAFHWHPFGVYAENKNYYDQGEWFTCLTDLKDKYKLKESESGTTSRTDDTGEELHPNPEPMA